MFRILFSYIVFQTSALPAQPTKSYSKAPVPATTLETNTTAVTFDSGRRKFNNEEDASKHTHFIYS